MDMGIAGRWAHRVRRQQGARQGLRRRAGGARASTSSSTARARRDARGDGRGDPQGDGRRGARRSRPTSPRPRAAPRLLAACPEPDILVNNAGGPPPGDFRDWDRDDWIKALDANMLTPIELIKATVDGMIERGFGRIVNITSARREGADRRSWACRTAPAPA